MGRRPAFVVVIEELLIPSTTVLDCGSAYGFKMVSFGVYLVAARVVKPFANSGVKAVIIALRSISCKCISTTGKAPDLESIKYLCARYGGACKGQEVVNICVGRLGCHLARCRKLSSRSHSWQQRLRVAFQFRLEHLGIGRMIAKLI